MTRRAIVRGGVVVALLGLLGPTFPAGSAVAHHQLTYPGLLDLQTGSTTRLADVDDAFSAAAWAPDGSFIVYGTRSGLLRIDLADGSQDFLTDHPSDSPRFSPDGSRLLYIQGESWSGGRLAIIDLDSGDVETLTDGGRSPAWSPDGDEIAYAVFRSGSAGEWDELRVLDLTTGEVRTLVERIYPSTGIDWAPNDDRIAYVDGYRVHVSRDDPNDRWDDMGSFRVHTIESDGSDVRVFDGPGGFNSSPAWSPDGGRIAAGGTQLTVYEVGNGTHDVIHEGPTSGAQWSPDGSRLGFFHAYDEGWTEFVVMDANGNDKTSFALDQKTFGGRWSPDGANLAVAERVPGEHPPREVESTISIERHANETRVALRGQVTSEEERCSYPRSLVVKKVRPGRDQVILRKESRAGDGRFFHWVPTETRGWFYAIAKVSRFTDFDSTPVTCLRAQSGRVYLNGRL